MSLGHSVAQTQLYGAIDAPASSSPVSHNARPSKAKLRKAQIDPPAQQGKYLIPPKPYSGPVTTYAGYRFLTIWMFLAPAGTALWYGASNDNVSLRVFGAGLIFPGGGYLGLGGWGILAFAFNVLLIPVCIFGWFWSGIVPLPIGVYLGSALLAAYKGRAVVSVLSLSPVVLWAASLSVIFLWFRGIKSSAVNMEKVRQKRNEYINEQIKTNQSLRKASAQLSAPGERELSPDQIKSMRFLINLTRQPRNSWKGFTHTDQFREGAYRYQLYEIIYTLSIIQSSVMPNYHGALKLAQSEAIERMLQPKVLYYWALEALWGRGSFDWDPIENENIMLSGWFLLALMMYTSTTRDFKYTKPGSLVFRTLPWLSYSHSIPSIMQALLKGWNECNYCLYACEPNWIYPICNSYGMMGAMMYDRVFKTSHVKSILPRFEKQWHEEFVNLDGNPVAIRSSRLGFQIPNTTMMGYASTAYRCAPHDPKLAERLWAIIKNECIEYDEKGRPTKLLMAFADRIDPGNYGAHPTAAPGKVMALQAAVEFGDEEIANLIRKEMAAELNVVSDGQGGEYVDSLSTYLNGVLACAKVTRVDDCLSNQQEGPPEYTFEGPLLAEVPYPEVVVAKAWSNGKDLDLVLYNGIEEVPGQFPLSLARLVPGSKYEVNGSIIVGDQDGNAKIDVAVEGRTAVYVKALP